MSGEWRDALFMDGKDSSGCLLPALELLWRSRVANELTGNVFRN